MCYLYLTLVVLFHAGYCEEITNLRAERNISYDGFTCPQSEASFRQDNFRSSVECVDHCGKKVGCSCVFYKKGYCQGCIGPCYYNYTLPKLHGTTHYYFQTDPKPALSEVPGVLTFQNEFYTVVQDYSSWQDAKKYCKRFGAKLLEFYSQYELDFISSQLTSAFYWTGGRRHNGHYRWSHDSHAMTFTSWAPNQPLENYECIGLIKHQGSYLMDDADCDSLHPFVCKSI